MGQDWRPNKAVSTALMVKIVSRAYDKFQRASHPADENNWLTFGVFMVVAYVISLRGSEGLLLDLKGLREHRNHAGREGDTDYFIIALMGTVKGEQHDRCHLFPCAVVTSSGISVREWVWTLVEKKEMAGLTDGPAISDMLGKVRTSSQLDEQLVEILEEVFDDTPSLFPASVGSREDIVTFYSTFRTPRRSSDTRAIEKNVSVSDIECVNRWEAKEKAKGNRPNMPMRQHYAQVELLLKPFLRYTQAM